MSIYENCSIQNNYACNESIFESSLSFIALVSMVVGFKKIKSDTSNTLVQTDINIYLISTLQMFLVFLFFTLISSDFIFSTIGCLNLIISLMMGQILSDIACEGSAGQFMSIFFQKSQFIIAFEWFWTAIAHKSFLSFFGCFQPDYMLISVSQLLIGLIGVYLGVQSVLKIKELVNQRSALESQGLVDTQEQKDFLKEMNTRKIQISILIYSLSVTSILEFLWNFVIYQYVTDIQTCESFYLPKNLFTFILLLILKFLVMAGLPLSIYIIFYWMNRANFSNQSRKREQDVLLKGDL